MNTRQVRRIFAVLAVLLILWLGVQILGDDRLSSDARLDLATRVGPAPTLIRIFGPGGSDSVRLELRDEWLVNGFPADTALIHGTLAALDSAAPGQVVALNPANHARMGVADSAARRVVFGRPDERPDQPSLTLLVGGTGRMGRFVRLPGEDVVYAVPVEALAGVDRDATGWRDRQIATLDTTRIGSITIRRTGEEARITRDEGWSVNGVAADSAAVARLLSSLASIQATGFPPDSVVLAADFDSPDVVLEVFGRRDDSAPPVPLLSLVALELEESEGYLVRRTDRPLAFGLTRWSGNRLLPRMEVLLGTTP